MLRRMATVVAATTALALAGAAPALAVTEDPGAPSGNGVQPEWAEDNPDCEDLLDADDFLFEHKTGVPTDETIQLSHDGLSGSLEIDVDGAVFDFTFTGDFVAAAVIVKGGPNANLYDYRPDGEDADTGLHAPVNPNNDEFYGLSHISFCVTEAPDETPPPTTPPPTNGETPPPTTPPTTPPTEDGETPKPVPTSVPAGYGQADNGSASTIGLLAFLTAMAIGGGALVTRRFLKDN
jgi:hypothetical protein